MANIICCPSQFSLPVGAQFPLSSPAGVAGFEANLAIAHARDQAIAKLAAEAIPSLEQLLAKAEKVVLEFYEVRELTLEVATLSAHSRPR